MKLSIKFALFVFGAAGGVSFRDKDFTLLLVKWLANSYKAQGAVTKQNHPDKCSVKYVAFSLHLVGS